MYLTSGPLSIITHVLIDMLQPFSLKNKIIKTNLFVTIFQGEENI